MKQLLAGIILIAIIGVAGFLYRNIQERPISTTPNQTACTLEAKLCPDGTSVGRSGPSCAFAACLPPNAEVAPLSIAYAVPAGYIANPNALGSDATLFAVYEKTGSAGNPPDAIVVRRYPIPAGKTANDVMLANTMYESSGNQPKSMAEFAPIIANGKTYQSIVLERFEAVVHSAYYLPRDTDVLRFEVLEHGIKNWTDPKLDVTKLPQHQAFLTMLATLQSN